MATATKPVKSTAVKDYISWMLFDLIEGLLLIGTFVVLGLALRGGL